LFRRNKKEASKTQFELSILQNVQEMIQQTVNHIIEKYVMIYRTCSIIVPSIIIINCAHLQQYRKIEPLTWILHHREA